MQGKVCNKLANTLVPKYSTAQAQGDKVQINLFGGQGINSKRRCWYISNHRTSTSSSIKFSNEYW